MSSLCPSRRLPATRGPGAAFTGITSPRPKSNCSNGVFTSHTSRSTQARANNGLTMDELMDQLGMSRAALTEWDTWYAYLTGQYGLSKKPAFIGMSRGGIFEFSWGTANPDKVSCIYADNPGMERQGFQRLGRPGTGRCAGSSNLRHTRSPARPVYFRHRVHLSAVAADASR